MVRKIQIILKWKIKDNVGVQQSFKNFRIRRKKISDVAQVKRANFYRGKRKDQEKDLTTNDSFWRSNKSEPRALESNLGSN